MSNYGPVVVSNHNFNKREDSGVQSMMETQSLRENEAAQGSKPKESGNHVNQPSIGRASQGK